MTRDERERAGHALSFAGARLACVTSFMSLVTITLWTAIASLVAISALITADPARDPAHRRP